MHKISVIGDREVIVPVLSELLDCVQGVEKHTFDVGWWIDDLSKGNLMSKGR